MNTEVKEKTKQVSDKKMLKLYEALQNNLEISKMNLPNKYEYLEQWELNKSRRMLYEINRKSTTYKRFSRGSIVKVDFGVNIGGEFSEPHFAIVLNKKDNMYNNRLTVIPLSSKKHRDCLNLGNLIAEMYLTKLSEEANKLNNEVKECNIDECEFISDFNIKIKKIERILHYYQTNENNLSYAYVDQIRTISKLNVLQPMNEYDIVNKLVCSKDIMHKIDNAIIKKFTEIDYVEFEKFLKKHKKSSEKV